MLLNYTLLFLYVCNILIALKNTKALRLNKVLNNLFVLPTITYHQNRIKFAKKQTTTAEVYLQLWEIF